MTFKATVINGVIVLPPDVVLPDGTLVDVTACNVVGGNDPFAALVEKLAKPRTHLPEDYALNHGHYVRGEPKK